MASDNVEQAGSWRTLDALLGPADVEARPHAALGDAWAKWVAELADWQLAATLTFDPKRRTGPPPGAQRGRRRRPTRWPVRFNEDGLAVPGAMTRDVAESYVRRWLRHVQQNGTGRLMAIAALEYHKNGWPHFHALLSRTDGFTVQETADMAWDWQTAAGFCRLEAPRSVAACAAYAAKYLTKDLDRGTVLFWPPRGPLVRGELFPPTDGTGADGGPG